MSATQTVLLVVGILASLGVVFGLIRKRQNQMILLLQRVLAASGEKLVLAPERASYRGALKIFSSVKSSGVLALTSQRVIFQPILGSEIKIPVKEIKQITGDKWFLKNYHGGHLHLIIHTANGNQIGFITADFIKWKATLESEIAGFRT